MLSKFFLRAAFTAAALTSTTGSASAEQYRILLMEHSFFPDISFVQPGDEVVFVNMSGETRTVAAEDGSWIIPTIADNSEATLALVEGMPNKFSTLAASVDPEDTENPDGKIIGTLNFSGQPAPTETN